MICQFVYLYMEKFSSNLLPTVKNITEGITEWTSKNWFLMFSFFFFSLLLSIYWSSRLEVFFVKVVLKIRSNFTGKHPSRSVISIKLQSNFIEITLWHGCSPIYLLNIFWTPFLKNSSGRLLLNQLCGNCAFPQNFHTRKSGEITVNPNVYRSRRHHR